MPGAVGGGLEPGWWQGVLGLARGCWHYGTPQNPLPTLHPSCPPSLTQPVKGWGGFPSPSTPKSDPPLHAPVGEGGPRSHRDPCEAPAMGLGIVLGCELSSQASLAFSGQLKVSEGATKSGQKLQISPAFLRNRSGCLLGSAPGYAAPFSATQGCLFPRFLFNFFLFLFNIDPRRQLHPALCFSVAPGAPREPPLGCGPAPAAGREGILASPNPGLGRPRGCARVFRRDGARVLGTAELQSWKSPFGMRHGGRSPIGLFGWVWGQPLRPLPAAR